MEGTGDVILVEQKGVPTVVVGRLEVNHTTWRKGYVKMTLGLGARLVVVRAAKVLLVKRVLEVNVLHLGLGQLQL